MNRYWGAQKSRLPAHLPDPQEEEIVPVSDIQFEQEVFTGEEVICEIALTRSQVDTLVWILKCWLDQYEASESSQVKQDAQTIHVALSEV